MYIHCRSNCDTICFLLCKHDAMRNAFLLPFTAMQWITFIILYFVWSNMFSYKKTLAKAQHNLPRRRS
jgi:hypothetical protein